MSGWRRGARSPAVAAAAFLAHGALLLVDLLARRARAAASGRPRAFASRRANCSRARSIPGPSVFITGRYPVARAGMLRRVDRPDLAPWRLVREPLGETAPPIPWPRMAAALRGEARPLALVGRWAGGGAILASEPLAVVRGPGALAVLDGAPGAGRGDAVGGGWFGWIAYEDGRALEPSVPPGPPARALGARPSWPTTTTSCAWARTGAGSSRRSSPTPAPAPCARGWRPCAGAPPSPAAAGLRDVRWRAPGPAGHGAAVAACVERIAAGDLSQANLAATIEARLDGHPLDVLARGAAVLRARPRRGVRGGRPRDRLVLPRAVPAPGGRDRRQRADQGHRRARGRRPGRAAGQREGRGRARDDRRPGPQRPGARERDRQRPRRRAARAARAGRRAAPRVADRGRGCAPAPATPT